MTDIAKCTSWLGHKFEGRYSASPAVLPPGLKVSIAVDSLSSIYERFRQMTYERDVCVRCGAIIERNHTPQTAKPPA